MTRRVEVWGHSDDLIEIQSPDKDYISEELVFPYDEGPVEYHAAGVLFLAEYDGEWSFDVWATNEGTYINKYRVGMGPAATKNDYTQCLLIYTDEKSPIAYRI